MIDEIIREDLEKIRSVVPADKFRDKHVLVTGGAGFIGSWLTDVLISFGANVTVVDNFSTGRTKNIDHLTGNKGFKLVNTDVCDYNEDQKIDIVFHMAAHASPDEYMAHPIDTLLTSALGTQKIAELATKNNATLLFASTSECYGDAEVVPTPETYWGKVNPIGPRSCYDEGKRFAEALLMAYSKQYGLDVRVPRIFNSYGPRLREDGLYGRALSRFVMQALSKQPITVYGNGKQTRAFCYITDTVTGLMLLTATSKAKGEVVNVGNTTETTIIELAEKIREATNRTSNIEFYPLPKDDPRRRQPDAAKLEALVGWKPSISLNEGLERTIKWFSQQSG
jgi:UDP-glucuronate decarboxylase